MRLLLPTLMLAGLAACAWQPAAERSAPELRTAPGELATTFIVVRHAEKSDDHPDDPALDTRGQVRARALAQALAGVPLTAVYATPVRRARETAAPAAAANALEVRDYDPELAASELATMLHIRHAGDTVLLVGHSNTVPDIVTALCACAVGPMTEQDYGDLYRIRIASGGSATLEHDHF